GIVLPVAAVAAIGFYAVFATLEYGSLDASLGAQAQVLTSALEDQNGRVDPTAADPLPSVTQAGIAVNAVLFSPDGAVVDHSGQVRDPGAYAVARGRATSATTPVHDTFRIDGVSQRLLVQQVDF